MKFCKVKLFLFIITAIAVFYSPAYSNEIDTSKTYYIQSAQEYGRGMRGMWDIPGAPNRFHRGQNIQVWDLPSHDRAKYDRVFRFHKIRTGVYEISSRLSYTSRVDIAGARSNNGTNVGLWDRNNNRYAQRFRISYRGNGRWKFYTMHGRVVCLAGRSSRNGSNVHIWQAHSGPWTEWVLIPRFSYRAFMPQKYTPRPVTANIRGLTANIVYTQQYYSNALRVGSLLRQRGMRIRYTRTNSGHNYAGKILYKRGFYPQARTIQNLIQRYIRLIPQQGRQVNSYVDKQFNIWVTTPPARNTQPAYANLRNLTVNIIYVQHTYNKALRVGSLLRQRGMRIRYTKTGNGNSYAGKILYKPGYYSHARSIQNVIKRYAYLTPQRGAQISAYRDKQFNVWVTR